MIGKKSNKKKIKIIIFITLIKRMKHLKVKKTLNLKKLLKNIKKKNC